MSSLSLRFFFQCSADHRDLHSFPTRRSSDLRPVTKVDCLNSRIASITLSGRKRVRLRLDSSSWLCGPSRPEDESKRDRKSTRLNSSHANISYAVFCLKKKKQNTKN